MSASPKKFYVDVDLAHNVLSRARITTSAFSGASVGEIRYDVSNEQISWWTNAGSEKKITDIPLSSFTASNAGDINLNGYNITNLDDPVNPTDAVNKSYVDAVAQGLHLKASVIAMAGSNISSLSGTLTIDDVSLIANDRVLLIAQTTPSENGIWVVKSGSWERPLDFNTGYDASSDFVFVQYGTIYADTGWVCISDVGSAVVDTDDLVFSQFSGAGSVIAGAGLTQTGNTFDIGAGNGITVNANDISLRIDSVLGVNLVNAFSLNSNGLALKIDDTTVGVNGSNQLQVKNNSITESNLTTSVAGGGLVGGNGTAISVGAGLGIVVNSDDIAIDTSLIPRKYSANLGNNSDVDFVVTHSLNTRDVIIQVWETSGSYERVYPDIELTSVNTVTIKFTVAPTTNQYRIVILG